MTLHFHHLPKECSLRIAAGLTLLSSPVGHLVIHAKLESTHAVGSLVGSYSFIKVSVEWCEF